MSSHFDVHPTGSDLDDATAKAVSTIEKANSAIDSQRARLASDPDTLSDKALRSAVPAVAGLLGSRGLAALWKKLTGRDHTPTVASHDGLALSMLFAAASAALGVLLSHAATTGVSAIIRRRQRRRR